MEGEWRLATGVPTRLTPAEGRKFGLTVGIAFLVLTALVWWRGRMGAVYVLGSLGTLLVLAGLIIPARLGPVNRAWMGLAHLLSKVTTPIFMGIVYFVVLTPTGVIMRLLGRNPMKAKATEQGFWYRHNAEDHSDLKRQF
jgi:hypothetical protein